MNKVLNMMNFLMKKQHEQYKKIAETKSKSIQSVVEHGRTILLGPSHQKPTYINIPKKIRRKMLRGK